MKNSFNRTGERRSEGGGTRFYGPAIASISLGLSSLTLAVIPWAVYSYIPVLSFLGNLMIFPAVPAAVVGLVMGIIAMRRVGAAAHASRPMAQWGLITSTMAALLLILWIVSYYSLGLGTMEGTEPDGDVDTKNPDRIAQTAVIKRSS